MRLRWWLVVRMRGKAAFGCDLLNVFLIMPFLIVSLQMSTPFYSNVFFLCTARMAGQAIIVASYSYNTETELGAVKQVLEQPTINLSPGKHYSFNAGEVSWHLISGKNFLRRLKPIL